ncbi:hypothetical protein CAMRE0001_2531 [Campylobacter rectus RM3267]|uniref:Uncharacterized protein n=1 Tax=Campylobacter rectus RM3267 TaxID=553218 RepID=B9D3R7_CAMRE|nr:hypothetical protein CAMRE0001_2531 [Campylobacter rectus RM3267]
MVKFKSKFKNPRLNLTFKRGFYKGRLNCRHFGPGCQI